MREHKPLPQGSCKQRGRSGFKKEDNKGGEGIKKKKEMETRSIRKEIIYMDTIKQFLRP